MEESIDISVITATYAQSEYIADCIQSVLRSKSDPDGLAIEHIVVNDASPDNTNDVIQPYLEKITYIVNNTNVGPAAARNIAISQAHGRFILVLDSDDVLLQRTLYHCFQALQSSTSLWLFTDFIRSDANLSYLAGQDYYGWKFLSKEDMLTAIFNGTFFIQHNTMFARDLFHQVGGYDETMKMAEDLDLYIRFLLAGEFPEYLPITSHIHRFHNKNLSIGQGGARHLEQVSWLKEKYKGSQDSALIYS